jgi:AraC-like DNA-binding protein
MTFAAAVVFRPTIMTGGVWSRPGGRSMAESEQRLEMPPPGGVAWLDVSAQNDQTWSGRARTGPLGLRIAALPGARSPYFFKGGRLRGLRCIWSAATVSGAELTRPTSASGIAAESTVHLLVRADSAGSVFDGDASTVRGTMRVIHPAREIREQFANNTHLFTLNVPRGTLGVEPTMLAEMLDESFEITPFQMVALRSAVGLLTTGADELRTSSTLVGVDRYVGALAGLLLRTAVRRPGVDLEQMETIRGRTDMIIFERAADPLLSPASIAAQLNISLRQLYRAFNGTESPAARIRRRRLEHAAELLAARAASAHVERIAQESGFASAEYFSRAFRREFGLSPRAYRSAHRDLSVAVPAERRNA